MLSTSVWPRGFVRVCVMWMLSSLHVCKGLHGQMCDNIHVHPMWSKQNHVHICHVHFWIISTPILSQYWWCDARCNHPKYIMVCVTEVDVLTLYVLWQMRWLILFFVLPAYFISMRQVLQIKSSLASLSHQCFPIQSGPNFWLKICMSVALKCFPHQSVIVQIVLFFTPYQLTCFHPDILNIRATTMEFPTELIRPNDEPKMKFAFGFWGSDNHNVANVASQ